ncbi:MAG: hypothetical protein J7L53_11415 [Deltaproteobacteria bacterium]|nr:hypothetical protein [Deltaproteobacteria bacterium]
MSLSFKRFLLIHPSEAKGEAIPPEPEGQIGITRPVSEPTMYQKNISGKRKNPHPEDIFMLGCVHQDTEVYKELCERAVDRGGTRPYLLILNKRA